MTGVKPKRKSFGENMNIVLVTQVGGVCPRCDVQLMYTKAAKKNKNYELAHIYPLHPTAYEIELLQDEERLNKDVDHEDNLIPLCANCHTKFDKPRTVEDYRDMISLKKAFMESERQRALINEFTIEKDITQIIDALYAGNDVLTTEELSFQPKKIEDKLDGSMTNLTKNKIQYCVTNYFSLVRRRLALMESENPISAENISLHIRLFYNEQAKATQSQQVIFTNIVEWIKSRTKSRSVEAPEILASFFVQNCEIFK